MSHRPRIEFDNGLVLTADSKQWILSEKKIRESGPNAGEPYEKDIAFCTSLSRALRRVLEEKLRGSGATSVQQLQMALSAFYAEVDALFEVRVKT